MNKRERNTGFTQAEGKKVPVALQGYKVKKRDRIVEELKVIIKHDKWELATIPFITGPRKRKLEARISEFEKEIERREGK